MEQLVQLTGTYTESSTIQIASLRQFQRSEKPMTMVSSLGCGFPFRNNGL